MQQRPAPTEMFTEGNIQDVVIRDLRKFNDSRGWLSELFRHDELTAEFLPAVAYTSSNYPIPVPLQPCSEGFPFSPDSCR